MKNILLLALILALSCNRDDSKNDPATRNGPICPGCLLGKWKLSYAVSLVGTDTDAVFKNGNYFEYWYGERRWQYPGQFNIEFLEDSYKYYEVVEEWGNKDDTVQFTDNWKWKDAYVSKTYLDVRIDFNSADIIDETYRVISLSDTVLCVEKHSSSYGGEFYRYFRFVKYENDPDQSADIETRNIQKPSEIAGDWKLKEYNEIFNEDNYTKFSNDTLIRQFYSMEGYNPVSYIRTQNKNYCTLFLHIDKSGDLKADMFKDNTWVFTENTGWVEMSQSSETLVFKDYWYWTDNISPHDSVYMFPLMNTSIINYKIKFSNSGTLELFNGNVYYKYEKVN